MITYIKCDGSKISRKIGEFISTNDVRMVDKIALTIDAEFDIINFVRFMNKFYKLLPIQFKQYNLFDKILHSDIKVETLVSEVNEVKDDFDCFLNEYQPKEILTNQMTTIEDKVVSVIFFK